MGINIAKINIILIKNKYFHMELTKYNVTTDYTDETD